jgi:hypothetical protein
MDMDEKPKLRPVEVFPIQGERGTMVCLRDASGFTDRVVTASPRVIPVLQLLDGRHSILDIQADLTRRTGEIVYSDDIRRILSVLDEALLLEGERFEAHKAQVLAEFARATVRKSASAGHSYPDDAGKLGEFIDGILAEAAPAGKGKAARLRGLVAPHIDHARGRKSYAEAYAALSRSEPADLYILLGTAHAETAERFVLTRKDFETPLGTAETDRDFVDALAKRAGRDLSGGASGRDLFADEFAHRAEHSIELELVFVQRLAQKAKHGFKIVPILCGGYQEAMEKDQSPTELPGVKDVIEALRALAAKEKRRVCVIAGADLAHVGPRFGGGPPVTDALLASLDAADRETLGFVEKGDADGFVRQVVLDENARNICGVAAIYVALKVLEPCRAKILRYEQWCDDDGSSAVTFAACAIT